MRLVKSNEDCADCLCRVCARNVINDCCNSHAAYADCESCENCFIGETYVVELEEDCLGQGFLPDEEEE